MNDGSITPLPDEGAGLGGATRSRPHRRRGGRPLGALCLVLVLVAVVAVVTLVLRDSPASTAAAPDDGRLLVSAPAGEPLRVLFAGDSITDGAFALDPGRDAFPALVEQRLSQDIAVSSKKIGYIGYTTAMVLPAVAGAGPADLIVVELGTNDANHISLDTFRSDYPAMMAALRATSPDAAMVCTGTWHQGALARAMDQVIEAECTAHAGRYVDLDALFDDPANHGPAGAPRLDGTPIDWFHPNDAGHAGIAAAVLGALDLSGLPGR